MSYFSGCAASVYQGKGVGLRFAYSCNVEFLEEVRKNTFFLVKTFLSFSFCSFLICFLSKKINCHCHDVNHATSVYKRKGVGLVGWDGGGEGVFLVCIFIYCGVLVRK